MLQLCRKNVKSVYGFNLHLVISGDGILTNCGFSFQESTDLEEEEDEDDKVSVLREAHGRGC